MNRARRLLPAALALLAVASSPLGAAFTATGAGGTSAAFLKLGVGARAEALSGAYAAAAEDADALFWNPAALSRVEGWSGTFMHAANAGSTSLDTLAVARGLGGAGTVAAGLQYFAAGGLDARDEFDAGAGSFHPYDAALSLGYAYRLRAASPAAGWSVGAAAKVVRSRIVDTAQTAAVDAGLLSPEYYGGRLRLGAQLANVGGTLRYETADEPLPALLRLGAWGKPAPRWAWMAGLNFPRDDGPGLSLGTEYLLGISGTGNVEVALRAGIDSRAVAEAAGFGGVTFGVGVGSRGLRLDYALVSLGTLGLSHRVSLSLRL